MTETDNKDNQENNNNQEPALPEEVKSKLSEVDELKKNFSHLSQQLEKLLEQKESPKPGPQEEEGGDNKKLSLKSLQGELDSLRNELSQKEQEIVNNKRDDKIKNFFYDKNISYADSAYKLFLAENRDNLVQEDGEWFIKKGDQASSLDKALQDFVERPDISAFKEVNRRPGGVRPPQKAPGSAGKEKSNLNEQVLDALAGLKNN